jgi:hypothetical protein
MLFQQSLTLTISEKVRDIKPALRQLFIFYFYILDNGYNCYSLSLMFETDTLRRIKELESKLVSEEEKYVNAAVGSCKHYSMLTMRRKYVGQYKKPI